MTSDSQHDRELAAWRAAFAAGQASGSAHCPDHEALAALALGELGGPARERVADHLVGCRACSSSYRSLVEIHAQSQQIARAGARRLWTWAAAAALLLAAGLALVGPRPGWRDPGADEAGDRLRSSGDAAVAGFMPAHDAKLDAAPAEFAWEAQPGASGYRVRLFDARAQLLWETQASVNRVELPRPLRERLAPGAYFWVVDVVGTARRRLGPSWFALKAGG